jgi:hypothetical protein
MDLYADNNFSEEHTVSISRAEVHTALQPIRPTSTSSPPWEPQIVYRNISLNHYVEPTWSQPSLLTNGYRDPIPLMSKTRMRLVFAFVIGHSGNLTLFGSSDASNYQIFYFSDMDYV